MAARTLDTNELLHALEDDMLAHHSVFASLPNSVKYDEADCFFYTSEINFGAFGGILAQRFAKENAKQRVDELNTAIRQTGKDIGWVLSPVATPGNLEEVVIQSGARKIVELKGMAMDTDDLVEPHQVEGLMIKSVESDQMLVDYARIYPLLYHVPLESWIEQLVAAELYIYRRMQPPWSRWLAYLHGKPVAACRTGQVSGVASLQILCTLPEYRNKGIGHALAAHGLKFENRQQAIVWAGPDADRLYSRMGFNEISRTSVYDLLQA